MMGWGEAQGVSGVNRGPSPIPSAHMVAWAKVDELQAKVDKLEAEVARRLHQLEVTENEVESWRRLALQRGIKLDQARDLSVELRARLTSGVGSLPAVAFLDEILEVLGWLPSSVR